LGTIVFMRSSVGTTTRSKLFKLVLGAVLIFNVTVAAKCPTGTVTVRGKVENLPSTATGPEASVVVETGRGDASKNGVISAGKFTVEVPFSTQSSSFLGEDRCHTVPKFVEVKIVAAGKVYVQKRIKFKDNFEMYSSYLYRLKQDLSIDMLKEGANGAK
jgi:hypothetical protein